MSIQHYATSKPCKTCGIVKPLDEFPATKRNRDGKQGRRKACFKALGPRVASHPADYVPPESKPCTRCKVEKPLSDYPPNRANRDGRQSECRECNRARQKEFAANPRTRHLVQAQWRRSKIKFRYGIALDEYERCVEQQGGLCAICKNPPTGKSRNKHLHVDHDHNTGRVRGLLCSKCNTALGTFGDDLDGIMKVVEYLRRTD